MKLTNKIVSLYGADKVMHCAVSGWATTMAGMFSWIGMLVVTILLIALSIIKERCLDEEGDKKDTLAACIGMAISWVVLLITLL